MAEFDLSKVDKNFAVECKITEPDMKLYDIRENPFQIYGLYDPKNQEVFKRLPDEVGLNVNDGVKGLYLYPAGGRVRFCTDSRYIILKAVYPSIHPMAHMPLTGSSGFDLYIDSEDGLRSHYYRMFVTPHKWDLMKDGYEAKIQFPSRKKRYVTINFPTYNGVDAVYLGLQEDAYVGEGASYRPLLPMVYYGSSITQGGCASRPGNNYQNIVCREFAVDYLNLGFSGSGKGEDSIVEYMATLPMSAFICDYDHNATGAQHLLDTHEKMYRRIRAAHPDIPYIIMSRPDFDYDHEQSVWRREAILRTYHHAKADGDQNVFFIDGDSIFRGRYRDCGTVDGVHPNDYGFVMMADAVIAELYRAGF